MDFRRSRGGGVPSDMSQKIIAGAAISSFPFRRLWRRFDTYDKERHSVQSIYS